MVVYHVLMTHDSFDDSAVLVTKSGRSRDIKFRCILMDVNREPLKVGDILRYIALRLRNMFRV